MNVQILGAAAGGGLPQWNCRCTNCESVRQGKENVRARSQSSIAVSGNGTHWFLFNASADVRQQLLGFNQLWPPEGELRGIAIAGCIVTDAEIDHVSGLLQLREGSTFPIYSTALVRKWLTEDLPINSILSSFSARTWNTIEIDQPLELTLPSGQPSGLSIKAIDAGTHAPRYVPSPTSKHTGSVIGLEIIDLHTQGRLLYAPGVVTLNTAMRHAAESAHCVMIDGTFWSNEELVELRLSTRTASQMGHIPVDGKSGTLKWLASLSAQHRVYIHINNTNPMLDESGPQHHTVTSNGIRVGQDGDTFTL